jgi:hypothetical protein
VQKQTGAQPLEGQRHRGKYIPLRNRGVLYLLMLNSWKKKMIKIVNSRVDT